MVVFSSLFYASYGIWTKLMGASFGGYTASALRSILVLVFLLPIAAIYRQLEPVNFRRNGRYLLGMTLSSLLIWGPLYYAILHAGVGISLAINYAGIVIGMLLFGWLFAGENITRDKVLSIILSLVGLALVFSPSVSNLGWVALSSALVSGLCGALDNISAKKVRYNVTQTTVFVWVTSAIANVFMALVAGQALPSAGLHTKWFFLVMFAVASVGASWFFVKGLKLIDAGAAGILGLIEIVFGVLFGALFFSERPGITTLVGMAVIIAAAAIPYIKDYNTKRGTLDIAQG